MNKYKASALSHKGRSAILDEAKKQGVIIQRCKSNGEVLDEFAMVSADMLKELIDGANELSSLVVDIGKKEGIVK